MARCKRDDHKPHMVSEKTSKKCRMTEWILF